MQKRRLLKRPKWTERNFVTEVLLPSLFQRKAGTRAVRPPIFPKLEPGQFCITWIGHASFLVQTPGANILIDPNWANWLLVIRRLKHAGLHVDHLPNIDLVLITHAHFDHLNRRSLRQIARGQPIVVPKGVGNLVGDLGFDRVLEMEWWDETGFDGVEIVFTPAKHWGARMLADRHRGYGGYVIRQGSRSVYHGGDSAYFDGFKEIGRRLAPEIALLPIGAYQPPSFRDHHISPEQALKAFTELKSKVLIPMHWGTYRLSYEALHEPPQRLMQAALKEGFLDRVKFLIEGMPQVF
jgi:L-ascorbate metabolism protein UlaG (beta-lactamase superfamily)